MKSHHMIRDLIQRFNLKEKDIYMLDLIPLIEMIWADNKNQVPELQLLYEFTIKHVAEICNVMGNENLLTADDANDFIDRFAHNRPDPKLLKALREMAIQFRQQGNNKKIQQDKQQTMLNYCMDIAAACVEIYPYDLHERIMDNEKLLICELINAFNISPDTKY